jgi:hypothetical protein
VRSFEFEVGIAPGGRADSLLTEGQFLETEARQHWFGAASNGCGSGRPQLSHAGIDVARLGRAKLGEKRASKGRRPLGLAVS